ncbi:conserved exported hypothetical protein [Alteromonas sp. 38]|uniref:hypothetical protein n=1 Tax=unclassified Alteromonas TaxID=2614992 RepID=UPI0012F45E3F|nr:MULTISPECIES: hypothetical protein [unclassified Alteromonas]CAD5260310.1 conserved exported hypothetical protein [Alteromonas sp. 154]VXC32564.1 conserved exported hypothetical protein [Alteromonas sp. 38]
MNKLYKLGVVLLSIVVVGCAVSADPREQSTSDRIWASVSGLDEKTIASMQEKLDGLNSRVKGIDEEVDYYMSQLYLVKKELSSYELTEQQLTDLKLEIEEVEKQTLALNQKNKDSALLIKQKNAQLQEKEGSKDELVEDLKQLDSQVGSVESQVGIVSTGIKDIVAMRTRYSLEE